MEGLIQEYDKYTDQDYLVWKTLFNRQMEVCEGRAHPEFLLGLRRLEFAEERIPQFDRLNVLLDEYTGWGLEVVRGLIDDDLFFGLLNNKKFPSSTWFRSVEQLDYLEEPDMFHDIFGHVPLLTNKHYVDFLYRLSGIALKFIDSKLAIELLSRIYWFTIEFGLILHEGSPLIYGSGILSSAQETTTCLDATQKMKEYDVAAIMANPYYKHDIQDRYYVIDSFEELYLSIPQIEKLVNQVTSKYPILEGDYTKMSFDIN